MAAFPGPRSGTSALAFSPDGRRLASASGVVHGKEPSTVQVWEIATGREWRRFDGHRSGVNALAFATDGRSLVSGGEDGTVLVWDLGGAAGHEPARPDAGDRPRGTRPVDSPEKRARP